MIQRINEESVPRDFCHKEFLLIKNGYWDSQNDILGGNSSGVMPLNYLIPRREAPSNPYDAAESFGAAALEFCHKEVSLGKEWL